MTSFADFRKWLWSDWGKPNFLTRAGVPRVMTTLVAYWLAPYLSFVLTMRFVPGTDKESVRRFVHDPFILLAYAVFYSVVIADSFLEFTYNLKGLRPDERFRLVKHRWKDPLVKIYWTTLLISMFLSLLAFLHFRHQLR
jgi:hypothetical protein